MIKKRVSLKKGGWREGQLIKKNQGRRQDLISWLILLVVVMFLGLSAKIIEMVNDRILDESHKINILIYNNENFFLVSFSPEEKSLVSINIPPNLYVDVPGGYGKFQLFAVPKLASFERKKDLVLHTFQDNFMMPVDGYIVVNDDKSLSEQGGRLISSIFLDSLKNNITDLKPWDLIRLWWVTKGIGKNRFKNVSLTNENVLNEKVLPDKTKIYVISPDKYDVFIQEYSIDVGIRKERKSIEVLNGTEYSNLAQRFSRFLTNIGGVVISVGNTNPYDGVCLVNASRADLETYTTRKIVEIFGCQEKINREVTKSDLSVIIGKKFWDQFYIE